MVDPAAELPLLPCAPVIAGVVDVGLCEGVDADGAEEDAGVVGFIDIGDEDVAVRCAFVSVGADEVDGVLDDGARFSNLLSVLSPLI